MHVIRLETSQVFCVYYWERKLSLKPSNTDVIYFLKCTPLGPSLYNVRVFQAFFEPPTHHERTFSLHKVRENCHFLDHPPTPMSLRNIKMAPRYKLCLHSFTEIWTHSFIDYSQNEKALYNED